MNLQTAPNIQRLNHLVAIINISVNSNLNVLFIYLKIFIQYEQKKQILEQ